MRGILFCFLMFVFKTYGQDVSEGTFRLIRVCELCTCSEIPDSEVGEQNLVLNIQCSEQDRIDDVSDLDKILWPENPNHLTVNAAFEGLGISTLGKLPPNPQVEILRLTNNAIETYWPDPFADLPALKKLSLAQNKLPAITPDLFTAIDSLVELDLSYNQISDLNSLEFKNLRQVKRLNLQSNHLNKIPIEALQPMTALEDLDLSKNGIYDLLLKRSGADVLPNLRRLNLGGNRIRSVMKDSFPEKNNIEYLDLSNNIIEMVEPDSFLSCPNLREINLSQNNITLVFAFPPSVQVAILRMNTLYHWPEFPPGITYIDVSYNRLSAVYDESNAQFDNLEVLNVGGNQIADFNIENKLPKLFDLDISYNYITEVPKCINSQLLPSLEKLRLDGNPIENIYFKNIIALKTLYMYDMNKVEVVEDKAFSNVLGRDSEREEDSCFSLYLANCPSLREIKEGAFDMTSLCLLDISRNNLTSLPRGLTRWSRVTDGVNLQHNPWRCACALQWLLDDLLPAMYRDNSTLLTELRCGSPRAYSGLRLVHFYNWTERAMCSDSFMRSDPYDNYMLEPSTSQGMFSNVTPLSLILGGCILATMVIAIALSAYLLITRKKHRIRQAALNRKRQSAIDMRNSMSQKEQIAALNKV